MDTSNQLGFAHLDVDRARRTGIPEVIFAAGKTPEQVARIAQHLHAAGNPVWATRATPDQADVVRTFLPAAHYDAVSRIISVPVEGPHVVREQSGPHASTHDVAVVSAGTSDLPVAEEAAQTAEFLGCQVTRITDVGVAGLHRLINRLDDIRGARVIIAVAGMEGALPSVLGGLLDRPLIAVPTSVGYGASLGGITALLAMLNSCTPGITVVNIDNGFGAAVAARLICNVALVES